MSTTNVISESIVTRPEFFRLPRPGSGDPFFSLSRSFYYELEKRGELKMVRIKAQGKKKGCTLIEYKAVAALVRSKMGQQQAEPHNE
jgi:hypothetical protein